VVHAHDGVGIPVAPADLLSAFCQIKRKSRLDHYGVSVASIVLLTQVRPDAVTEVIRIAIGSTGAMSKMIVKGRVLGKVSSVSAATDIRSILPLPATMQLMDVLLPQFFDSQLVRHLPSIPGCFTGARPRTQCLDIAHGLQMVIEKGLDDFGNAALAQCDIEKYYDSLPTLLIMQWLVDKGAEPAHAACLVRHQMCPKVVLCTGCIQVPIGNRTVGGLTGSRTAGMLGRIPVESIVCDRHPHWQKFGFKAAGETLVSARTLTICSVPPLACLARLTYLRISSSSLLTFGAFVSSPVQGRVWLPLALLMNLLFAASGQSMTLSCARAYFTKQWLYQGVLEANSQNNVEGLLG
jgi:hypothetical protein